MPSKKLQKPNPESALSRLQAMAEVPRETPLERFILDHFEAIISLKTQGYTVPDIAKVLKEEGFASSPPIVHAALNRAATLLDKSNPYKRSDSTPDPTGQPDQAESEDLPESALASSSERLLPEPRHKNKLAY